MGGIRIFVLLLLVLSSSACSIKFAYNNMDRFVRWQISDYLDLNAGQRAFLKTEVAALMRWHRATHLPEYSEYVQGLAVQFSDGVSEAQVAAMFEQFLVWGMEIEERATPLAIRLMKSMSEEQLAALPAKLEESNLDIVEDELDAPLQEVQANWAAEFEDVLSRFTGRLTREQKDYLARRATAYIPERVLWVQYRRRWQADLMEILKRRHEAGFGDEFRALAAAREDYYGEEFTRVNQANIQLSREAASYLLSHLNEKQAQRFTGSLQDLAQDFAELAAAAE